MTIWQWFQQLKVDDVKSTLATALWTWIAVEVVVAAIVGFLIWRMTRFSRRIRRTMYKRVNFK